MTRPFSFRSGLLGALSALTAVSLVAGVAAAETKLTAVMHAGVRTLDPVFSTGHITRNHAYMVYDTLLAQDENFEPRPQMADWTVSDDQLIWTFTLREGLTFHDGAPVTAEDAVASLNRWALKDKGGQMILERTASLETKDERTFVWTLTTPFGPMLTMLSKQSTLPTFIMPKRVTETPITEAITDYTGSGPFRFVEADFRPGVSIAYEKFDAYVPRDELASNMAGGKVVKIDRVEWVTMPDEQTALNALIAGEIDYLERVPVDMLPIIEQEESVVAEVREPIGSMTMARMNFMHPPFDNKLVRQAALKAVSQEPLLAAMVGNPEYYKVCGAVLGCGMPLGSEVGADTLTKGGGTEEARKLLEQAGYDGTPVVLLHPTDVATLSTQPIVVAQQLREAGFTVDLQSMDWQSVLARVVKRNVPADGGWHMYITNWIVPEVADPLSFLPLDGRGQKAFVGWPEDPVIEKLKAEYMAATSAEQQRDVAGRIQTHALDEVLLVPLGQFIFPQGRRNGLSGMLPSAVPVFWNIELAAE